MEAEPNTNFERIIDEVLTRVHSIVEGQSEASPVEAVKEESENECNYGIKCSVPQVNSRPTETFSTFATTSNRTNPPNPTNPNNPSNASNPHNHRHRKTRKYFWSHGSCSHTSMYCNMKNTGHKYAATFFDKMEGSENYCRNTSE